jgi:hypothetical protein
MSGAEVLEGPTELAGKHIPVVIYYGFNYWIDGQHYYRGMVRFAKDAQRIYNYITSAKVEAAAASPKDPIWMTPAQAKGHTSKLERFNTSNTPFLFYNHDPSNPGAPRRTGAPAIQSALIEQGQQANFDIQAATGRFGASLGEDPGNKSGRAVLAAQRQSDVGTFEFQDNLAGAIKYTGEILVDLIPKVYDTERQIRVLSEDGQSDIVTINKTIMDEQTNTPVIINDLSQGKYDVVTDVGPTYNTKRVEALNFLSELSKSSPLFAQIAPDLLAKNVDFPFSEELSDRARKVMLSQGVVEPTQEELQEAQQAQQQKQPEQPSVKEQMEFQAAQLELESKAADVDNKELSNEKIKVDIESARADIQKKLMDSMKTKAETSKALTDSINEGGATIIPLDPDEIGASKRNMDLLNESLETQIEDVTKKEFEQNGFTEITPFEGEPQNEEGGVSSLVDATEITPPSGQDVQL